jgi:endonuclease-3
VRRAEKVQRIAAILDALYPEAAVPLDHEDPYTLLVAVVLSAQTTDAKVNQVTPGLFARASTPQAMARLPVAEIQRAIATLGLAPTKAKNLSALSRLLVERHGGKVPESFEELEALPGVGHKTASVVLVQAFGRPAFPVDTHIHRLAARWGLSSGKDVARTERDLKRLFPESSWGKVHLQLIYFGRERCPARGHDPAACPICAWAAPRRPRAAAAKAASAASAPRRGSRARAASASPAPRARAGRKAPRRGRGSAR